MTRVTLAVLAALLATTGLAPTAQTSPIKALVGGTLIDGFGGPSDPQQRDHHRGRADQGGRPGRHAGGAGGRGGDLHRRHERAPRPLGHARPPDDQRARRLRPLGQDLPGAVRAGDHAGVRQAAAAGRRHQRPRPRARRSRPASTSATGSTRARFPGPTLYVSGPFIQKAPYPGHRAVSLGRQRRRRRARQGRQAGRRRRRLHQADRPGPDDPGRGRAPSSTRRTSAA